MTAVLKIALAGIAVAAGLGTVFSQIYPRIEIDGSLALLFGVIGLLIVLAGRALWGTIKRDKT